MAELRARRDRIENAAEIIEGVNRALSALDASQVVDDVESSSATDLIDRASQALRAIHVDGVFSGLVDRLDSISTDLSDVVFTLSGEVDNDLGMEDLDAINRRIMSLTNWFVVGVNVSDDGVARSSGVGKLGGCGRVPRKS